MQKLITIYLDSNAYMGDRWVKGSHADRHGFAEEHLGEYLAQGWTVVRMTGLGGASEAVNARGWLAVVLQSPESG